MRLRNVRNANTKITSSPYVINEPSIYKGKYKTLFNNNNPIHIEIGMGKGKFIIENALKYPNINFIGIEKFDSVIIRAVEKLENMDLPNLKLIRVDALEIDEIFDHEIKTIYLNFSDPWPKKRHADRRLTSPIFLNKYNVIFEVNKHITMKTDNRELFEYSLKSLTDYGYKIDNISLDLYKINIEDNISTEYEEKFRAKGNIIYLLEAIMMDKD
jgi:tRNA (guanine-N7-)-methyltransferase